MLWFSQVSSHKLTCLPAPNRLFWLLQGNWIIKRFNMNRAGVTQVRSSSMRLCTEKFYFQPKRLQSSEVRQVLWFCHLKRMNVMKIASIYLRQLLCSNLFILFRLLSPRKQPTFGDATTGFPVKWPLRNEGRNSILMRRHYPVLGSASDWLNQISHAARPISSTTQIWVVTLHQYGISLLISQTSCGGETSPNVGCFLRLDVAFALILAPDFQDQFQRGTSQNTYPSPVFVAPD